MKQMAIAIVSMDLILLVIWFAASIYLVVKAGVAPCYDVEFFFHFFILIHFALGLTISNIVGEIEKEEYLHQERQEQKRPVVAPSETLQYLPYVIYSPFSWIFTSFIALGGDITLFASAIRFYDIGGSLGDECQPDRLARIFFDALALVISIISVLWFILFAIYAIAPQRRQQSSPTASPNRSKEGAPRELINGNATLRMRNIQQQRRQLASHQHGGGVTAATMYGVKK